MHKLFNFRCSQTTTASWLYYVMIEISSCMLSMGGTSRSEYPSLDETWPTTHTVPTWLQSVPRMRFIAWTWVWGDSRVHSNPTVLRSTVSSTVHNFQWLLWVVLMAMWNSGTKHRKSRLIRFHCHRLVRDKRLRALDLSQVKPLCLLWEQKEAKCSCMTWDTQCPFIRSNTSIECPLWLWSIIKSQRS